ncbi:thiamine phosphate synthase [Pelagivirga sediminicola]|uniref:Thiamine-phosphate synthase n=1 Tax=Pelagivirga sediminicola TaxID=2170575 RepID=A0A2T7G6E0_9RHOB|nr:thiamine phosphate synthase [Pelagivirga sediminicola]PVA09999.1 thiamine phosphate synthase [Pelagivirga sediminicola]
MTFGPVYFVTDPEAPVSMPGQVRAAVAAGVRIVQLRDKHASDADMLVLARALQQITRPAGAALIVNDRVQVAIEAGADGLHVGQGDGDIAAIRARIGSDMILGLSVETLAQLGAIPRDCVDYLGVGPLRATATKPDAAQPLGIDGLARIIAATSLPCVAIGGITHGDAAAIRQAGAAGIAVVSAISRAPDMEDAARRLITEWSAK